MLEGRNPIARLLSRTIGNQRAIESAQRGLEGPRHLQESVDRQLKAFMRSRDNHLSRDTSGVKPPRIY